MHTDCYEKGHTLSHWRCVCVKCGEPLILAAGVWHTQAELDRPWHGVDREAARVLGGEE